MKSLDLITIGRSSVDLYGDQVGGRLEDMGSFSKCIGGSPTNIACGPARCASPARRSSAASSPDPARLDAVAGWTAAPVTWVRRAALVATLPWSRQRHPDAAEAAARERILGWAAGSVADRERFAQKAVGWWLRSLPLHDPDRVRAFLDRPGRDLRRI